MNAHPARMGVLLCDAGWQFTFLAGSCYAREIPVFQPKRRARALRCGVYPLNQQNIFFVGLMGAGKTTVGKSVAKRLGRPFFDSDHEIEARCGVRIPIIFELEGEDGFRNRESLVIDDLTQRDGIVLATGGGAVLRAENRGHLRNRGIVVYLRANPFDLWQRTRHDRNRPLLQTDNPRAKLEALYAQRDPLYREVAHFVIETGKPSVSQLVNMVLMQLEMAGVVKPSPAEVRDDDHAER